MKYIRVYGDSYCSPCYPSGTSIADHWPSILSRKLNCKEINKAVPGTSNAVIYTRLKEDIQTNKFSDNDTECIIFQFSTIGRYYNDYIIRKIPDACSSVLHASQDMRIPIKEYYEENKEHIKWAISEYSSAVEHHHMESTLYWLKHYVSARYPNIKIVVLFNSLYPTDIDTSLLTTTDNFICLDHFSLTEISFSEIEGNTTFSEIIKFTKSDPRSNHLSIPNLEILADSIFNIIKTNDKSYLNYDSFHKNNFAKIENKEQYSKLVTDGVIYHISDMYNKLPN